jgi:hypothetical protein
MYFDIPGMICCADTAQVQSSKSGLEIEMGMEGDRGWGNKEQVWERILQEGHVCGGGQ